MAYWFTGVFTRPDCEPGKSLPSDVQLRMISEPFVGAGLRMASQRAVKPNHDSVQRLLVECGIVDVVNWLFLDYVTWAGRIDSVYGLGLVDGQAFGPIDESEDEHVESAYLSLMGTFGVSSLDALSFSPFVRGFWGEQ